MSRFSSFLCLTSLFLAACGGPDVRPSAPDERGDLAVEARRAAMPPGLDGSEWRWVEAHCTEGPLDLLARGYAARLRVRDIEGGLSLVTDQVFATEQCEHTIVQHATLPDGGGFWQMEEVTRVAVPSTPECAGRPEASRPGDVRMREGRLEVLVQRSQWCGGLEVRMVFERVPPSLLADDAIVRRYAAYFTLGDAESMGRLFAQTGSLLEPFTRTETGDPHRHDGREAIREWFEMTASTSTWRAMRVVGIASFGEGDASGRVLTWEYMDPRLEEPLTGTTRFTMAAGEIFEAQIALTDEPALRAAAAAN